MDISSCQSEKLSASNFFHRAAACTVLTAVDRSTYFRAMEKELRANLLQIAETYCQHAGLAESTVGKRCVADARFFGRIRAENNFTVKTYDQAMTWFSSNWPEDLEWPAGIEKPKPAPVEFR